MKLEGLGHSSVEQLVQRFTELALAQDKAELHGKISEVNRLFDKIEFVKGELKSRIGDQRRALMVLYDHPNAQVRLKAAKATLAIAPEEARSVLERLIKFKECPQAGDAGMTLRFLDDGTFKPT
jgi:hypothetical protein